MATFTVTHHQRLSNVAVVQTLENTDIAIGQTITLSGLGHGLNGAHIVFAVPTYYCDEHSEQAYDSSIDQIINLFTHDPEMTVLGWNAQPLTLIAGA
jgi:hypothetical protein